ncbi:hypothetical protein ACFZAR_05590 [Streptomyces sp. NPDC008222]|uniref:hypothetical protein n=1 Tax=Streptomyces sp. NPDC008222 TaxID=3364820 RepID=UPI0036F006E6
MKRTTLFGKPYRWMRTPDGQLSLQPDIPIAARPPLTNPTMRDFVQAARRHLE